ncbi:MAG: type II secretion system protein [Magnetococcales bacterium]|nr:type II secretion system protein [Magnetococcales bacterium]
MIPSPERSWPVAGRLRGREWLAPRHQARRLGFTLLEMVMTITLLAVVTGMVLPILSVGFETFFLHSNIRESDSRALLALERMTRELRGADPDTLVTGASSISFTDQNGAAVSFVLNNDTLMRGGSILAEGVTALAFTVNSGTYDTTVQIDLTVEVGGQGEPFRTTVGIRN